MRNELNRRMPIRLFTGGQEEQGSGDFFANPGAAFGRTLRVDGGTVEIKGKRQRDVRITEGTPGNMRQVEGNPLMLPPVEPGQTRQVEAREVTEMHVIIEGANISLGDGSRQSSSRTDLVAPKRRWWNF